MTTCSIVVVDTGPLKTLAYGDQLDLLLVAGLPVFIADMVLDELRAKPYAGNKIALDFIETHRDKLHKKSTGIPEKQSEVRALGLDPGETAIKKILDEYAREHEDEYALLLFEDNGIAKRTFILPDNVYLITTRPFLQEMEKRGKIASAAAVLKHAEERSVELTEGQDARSLLNRKSEHDRPPKSNPAVRPF